MVMQYAVKYEMNNGGVLKVSTGSEGGQDKGLGLRGLHAIGGKGFPHEQV